MSRLVVISNRVAATGQGAAGAQGGLAGALAAALKQSGGLWVGWSGEEREEADGVPTVQEGGGLTTATIDLSPKDVRDYYNGYANSTLWPLFHFRIDLARFEHDTRRGYDRVNDLFAGAAAGMIGEGDLVWVHDYHFLPLGSSLRRRGLRNRIGFFLHIPWPPRGLLTSLPDHDLLVRSMFAYDLVGFQCDEWRNNFLEYCGTELGAVVDPVTGRVELDGEALVAGTFPIGIDWAHFRRQGETGEARQTEQRMLASTRHRTAMVGVDRLDYSKGLPERMDGLARFFEQHPDRVRDLVFIQIAPPSRVDIDSYRNIRDELERKTGRLNGLYSRIDMVPVRYVNQGHSAAELFGVYRAAKIGLVTPLCDGMNLVAKEYLAAQDPDDPGVLVLSQFAGAAQQLDQAVLVNPHSADDIAAGIARALDMPRDERQARWQACVASVRDQDIVWWTRAFLDSLAA